MIISEGEIETLLAAIDRDPTGDVYFLHALAKCQMPISVFVNPLHTTVNFE